MKTYIFILFALTFSFYYSFSIGDFVSSCLDHVPIIGDLKCIYEHYTGEDLITRRKKTLDKRNLYLVRNSPLCNIIKNERHFRKVKFFKASENSLKADKLKNTAKISKSIKNRKYEYLLL